ncbi:MAG: hypothetical protein IPO27_15480 [Bacteroidetes bacterium]|nr:hypothetical protein [Bacteroidota bacterium]
MKSLNLTAFLILFFAAMAVAQTAATEEDYNYMIKGYNLGVKSGMGLKEGYSVIESKEFDESHFHFTYISLGRKVGDKVEHVGYILKMNDNESKNEYFFGLPHNNAPLLERSFLNIRTLSANALAAFLKTYIRLDQGIK